MALSLSTQFPLLFPGSLAPDGHKAALNLSVFELTLQLIWLTISSSFCHRERQRKILRDSERGVGVAWGVMTGPFGIQWTEEYCVPVSHCRTACFFLSFLIQEDSGVKSPKHHKGICQGYIYQQYTSTQDSQKQLTRQDYDMHIRRAALVLS